jgi:ATP-binding cassette subfamily F protein 3
MIHVSNLEKRYGNKVLYRNGAFQLNPGEKLGLVGPNGAGKTTIFRILMGERATRLGRSVNPSAW